MFIIFSFTLASFYVSFSLLLFPPLSSSYLFLSHSFQTLFSFENCLTKQKQKRHFRCINLTTTKNPINFLLRLDLSIRVQKKHQVQFVIIIRLTVLFHPIGPFLYSAPFLFLFRQILKVIFDDH